MFLYRLINKIEIDKDKNAYIFRTEGMLPFEKQGSRVY